MNPWRWFRHNSKRRCPSCKPQFSCHAWRTCHHLDWTCTTLTNNSQASASSLPNSQTSALTMILSTSSRSAATSWGWVSRLTTLTTPKRCCIIYFRRSLSTKAPICHEPDHLKAKQDLAGEIVMRRTLRRRMARLKTRILIFHRRKLTFEFLLNFESEPPITWCLRRSRVYLFLLPI